MAKSLDLPLKFEDISKAAYKVTAAGTSDVFLIEKQIRGHVYHTPTTKNDALSEITGYEQLETNASIDCWNGQN